MSEKRFIIVKSIDNYYALVDKERRDTEQILLLSLHKEQLNDVADLLNEQQYLLNNQNELLDEIFTIFQRYGIDTGYNKRILEIALENLANGDV